MSKVFISYKREDEARVARLVRALDSRGMTVWWDRGVPGGQNWRDEIRQALDRAKCVIVVWTRASVGPDGSFVRDEAARARERGILVPVTFDAVELPLGFGEIQAIDLTHWNGSARDPFFEDLCATVTAKVEGRAAPQPTAPMRRFIRRWRHATILSGLVAIALGFGLNVFRIQDRLCGMSLFQPSLSDACGAAGLGHRPAKLERVAWTSREPGSCAALRTHIERFPDGSYRSEAADLLAGRRVSQQAQWVPAERRLVLFVGQDRPSPDRAAAEAAALARSQSAAERLCKGFAVTTSYRLKSVAPHARTWECRRVAAGMACGFEGEAVCGLEEQRVIEEERCAQ